MGSFTGPEIVTNGLVFAYDMSNTPKSWKGAPTTNLSPNLGLVQIQGSPTLAYVGVENGWKKYSLNGTWSAGTYPYSIGIDGVTFTGGVTYSSGVFIRTNVPGKFANLFGGMNYVNEPMNNGGTSFSVAQPDGSFYVGRTGFQYTSTTAQTGYILSQPVVGQSFSSATDFVYIKDGQVEVGSFPTPFVNGTRSSAQALLDTASRNTITATSVTYNSDGSFSFNGSNNYFTISSFANKPTTAITCEAWIRPTKATLSGTIRGAAISATNSMYLGIIDSIDGGLNHALHWANQTSNSRLYSWIGSVPNNGWSHIVGTYDGTTTRAYLNGVQVYSEAQSGTISDTTYVLGTYGQGLADGVHNFHGSLPLSRIYNRALTAAEVLQNFNANRGRFGI
jgi:hypothetical protein